MTPTQRTLKEMRALNRPYGIVERYIHATRKRYDLFGFIDIIALDSQSGIIGIQSCGQSFSDHYKKITIDCRERAEQWLKAGGKIELWGWRKVKEKRGGKLMIWKPRIKEITIEDLNENIK